MQELHQDARLLIGANYKNSFPLKRLKLPIYPSFWFIRNERALVSLVILETFVEKLSQKTHFDEEFNNIKLELTSSVENDGINRRSDVFTLRIMLFEKVERN